MEKNGPGTFAGKTFLITGVTGGDGSYLAEFLLAKSYEAHRLSTEPPHLSKFNVSITSLKTHILRTADSTSITETFQIPRTWRGWLRKFAGRSLWFGGLKPFGREFRKARIHCGCRYTWDFADFGNHSPVGQRKKTPPYQAFTSKLCGEVQARRQSEVKPFYSRSPYHFNTIGDVQDYATRWLWTYNNERPNNGYWRNNTYTQAYKWSLNFYWNALLKIGGITVLSVLIETIKLQVFDNGPADNLICVYSTTRSDISKALTKVSSWLAGATFRPPIAQPCKALCISAARSFPNH